MCYFGGENVLFVLSGNEKMWIPSKLVKISFEQERPPENPGCRTWKKRSKTTKQAYKCWFKSLCGKGSETGWDMNASVEPMNPTGYRVLVIYYYMPSLYNAWVEVILWSGYTVNRPIKFDAFHLIKHGARNHLQLLVYTGHKCRNVYFL